MSEGRPIRVYDYVNQPFERVRAALLESGAGIFSRATSVASARAQHIASGLRVHVAGLEIGKEIEIEVLASYDNEQPYYVLTGTGGIFAQRIGGPVDVVARASTQRLEYQNRSSSESFQPDRTDRVRSYGGGVGVRLGQELRLGFNVDRERRTSILPDHEYDGLKFGTSLTYGS